MKNSSKEIRNDLLFSRLKKGMDAYRITLEYIDFECDYDIVLAHETYTSGLAGLYVSEHFCNPLKILDVVEYPIFKERTSISLREMAFQSLISCNLTSLYAANVANHFDYIFASSQGQIDIMRNLGCNVPMELLRNCREYVELEKGSYLRQKYNLSSDDIILLYSNRAYSNCGVELMVSTLPLLDERFKLIVLGDVVPELYDNVILLAEQLQVSYRFFITDMLDPDLVLPITREADIALCLLEPVIDNHKHSLPNRIFDAVAAKVPVLGFDGTEIAEFIKRYNVGKVIPKTTPESIKETLILTIRDMVFLKKSVNNASKIFCWESEEKKFLEYLQEAKPSATKCLLIAVKDIRRNDRIRRLLSSLNKFDISVDVITPYLPFECMRMPNATYKTWRK
ncbi:glycosyltransferase [Okeania sp. SIO2B3]|uniref:glycosyltransferase n=1 Tax=Okeania sp. SIO2B3 TaxID=2607784 RepID=UPI0013C0D087|nr:glycosyltransferase [Okeania sp. SIO2B3]NET43896.1 glycosyltransferase [Okeania sp. SIO2B3]